MERELRTTSDWSCHFSVEFDQNSEVEEPIAQLKASIYGPENDAAVLHFTTNSSYEGPVDKFGFSGNGKYIYPHGVVYKGNFRDGMFHGKGTLVYPMGQQVIGYWIKGRLISSRFVFADGLMYESPWKYCKMPDRRFRIEMSPKSFQPAPNEYLTNQQPTPDIPPGCYYVGNGFYDTKLKMIIPHQQVENLWGGDRRSIMASQEIEIPSKEYEETIIKEFRKAGDDPIGYRPDLYEFFASGKQAEMHYYRREFMEEDASSSGSSEDSIQSTK